MIAAVAADIPKDPEHDPWNKNNTNNKLEIIAKMCKSDMLNNSTPDSSQTDSEEVSPQTQSKQKNTYQLDTTIF